MKAYFNRFGRPILSYLSISLAFIYISVFICTIPQNYKIEMYDSTEKFNYPFIELVERTNEKVFSLLSLDLGRSMTGDRELNYLISGPLVSTAVLLIGGILLSVLLGIIKGILDSRKGEGDGSSLKILSTIIPISLPDVLLIALLQKLAIYLSRYGIDVFKVAGSGTISHLLLPWLALSILPACYIARTTAVSIEECYARDFIKVAEGKGCPSFRILWTHVMKNCIGPIIGSLPSITTILIGNLIMVEYLFNYPGLVRSFFGFLRNNDRNGIIANIVILGLVYFSLDLLFKLCKAMFVKKLRGETV